MLTGLKKGTRNVVTIAALLIPGCGDANKQENNKQEPTDKATATNVLEPEPDLNTSTLPKNPDLEIETEHDALAKAEENDLSETDINKQEPTSDLKTKVLAKMSASDIEYNKAHNALDKWMTFYNRWLPENSTVPLEILPYLRHFPLNFPRPEANMALYIRDILLSNKIEVTTLRLNGIIPSELDLTDYSDDRELRITSQDIPSPFIYHLAAKYISDPKSSEELARKCGFTDDQLKGLAFFSARLAEFIEVVKERLSEKSEWTPAQFSEDLQIVLNSDWIDPYNNFFNSSQFLNACGFSIYRELERGRPVVSRVITSTNSPAEEISKRNEEVLQLENEIRGIFISGSLNKQEALAKIWEVYKSYGLIPSGWTIEGNGEDLLSLPIELTPFKTLAGLSDDHLVPNGSEPSQEVALDAKALAEIMQNAVKLIEENFDGKSVLFEEIEPSLIAFAEQNIPAARRQDLIDDLMWYVFSNYGYDDESKKHTAKVIFSHNQSFKVAMWPVDSEGKIGSLHLKYKEGPNEKSRFNGYYLDSTEKALCLAVVKLIDPRPKQFDYYTSSFQDVELYDQAFSRLIEKLSPAANTIHQLIKSAGHPFKVSPGALEKVIFEELSKGSFIEGEIYKPDNWMLVTGLSSRIKLDTKDYFEFE